MISSSEPQQLVAYATLAAIEQVKWELNISELFIV
jgi:hypothetical protein